MKIRKFKVYDIQWDADLEEALDMLPDSQDVLVTSENVSDIDDDEEVREAISEHLTEQYGFCHAGFQLDEYSEVSM